MIYLEGKRVSKLYDVIKILYKVFDVVNQIKVFPLHIIHSLTIKRNTMRLTCKSVSHTIIYNYIFMTKKYPKYQI